MKTPNEIHSELSTVTFKDIEQYLFDILVAFQIPNSTISRLVMEAKNNNFLRPIFVYKRAVIVYAQAVPDNTSLSEAEEYITQQYRLMIIINDERVVCKDLVTEQIVDFAPNDIGDYLSFFMPLVFGRQKDKDLSATTELTELTAELSTNLLLDNKESNQEERVSYILALIYISFCKTLIHDNGIELFFKNMYKFSPLVPSEVMGEFIEALSSSEDRSIMYQGLPYFGQFGGINCKVPNLSGRSFDLSVKIICYDVSDIDAEVLSSLIYRFAGSDGATGIYGHVTASNNVLKVLSPLFINKYEKRIEENINDTFELEKIKEELLRQTFFDPTNGPGCFLAASFNSTKELIFKINTLTGSGKPYELELQRYVGLVENNLLRDLNYITLWVTYLQYLSEINYSLTATDLKQVYESVNIQLGSQLSQDWRTICPNEGNVLLVGSPIYKGAKKITSIEKKQMQDVFGTESLADADYSSCWLFKAAQYIEGSSSRAALVITNSVCQGSQVQFLWPRIYSLGCEIDFAYRSFKWKNSPKHSTGVSVIIVGLSCGVYQERDKVLYADNQVIRTDVIGPYLVNSTKTIVSKRTSPLSSQLPDMLKGNMPYDGQYLLLDRVAKDDLIERSPEAGRYLKRIVGSDEFINNIERWCLWIADADFDDAVRIPLIRERIDKVREFRLSKSDANAQKLAQRPHQFREFRSSTSQTLVVPSVSSENRPYIPIGFIGKNTIVSNLAFTIYNCEPWVFGVISSRIHMTWIRTVCGSHETRLRYSSRLGYNTFPLPLINDDKKSKIASLVFDIISERENYCDRSLGSIYTDLPERLRLLHELLDREVESCYQQQPFSSDAERIKLLLSMYDKSEV